VQGFEENYNILLIIMKKILFSFLILSFLLSCEKKEKRKSIDKLRLTLTNYLSSYVNFQYKNVYNHACNEDKYIFSFDDFLSKNETGIVELIEISLTKPSYLINNLIKGTNSAKAIVEVTVFDYETYIYTVMGEVFPSVLKNVFSEFPSEKEREEANKNRGREINQAIKKRFRNKGMPLTNVILSINLILENNQWKIKNNWVKAEDCIIHIISDK